MRCPSGRKRGAWLPILSGFTIHSSGEAYRLPPTFSSWNTARSGLTVLPNVCSQISRSPLGEKAGLALRGRAEGSQRVRTFRFSPSIETARSSEQKPASPRGTEQV